jgi:transposase-like protein
MDPQQSFCPNEDCPARGHTERGNIRIHCRTRKRSRCTVCGKTFSERRGTPFLALKTDPATVVLVVALVAHGCPIAAIEAVFEVQRRTVRRWIDRAGTHCHAVHERLVLQPQVLQHVQADEVFVRAQRGTTLRGSRHRWLYLFSAICVSTRLWLGGVVSPHRSKEAASELAALVRRAALPGPLLVVVDGFAGYVAAFTRAFRVPLCTGRVGRPRLLGSTSLVLVQHVKRSACVCLAHGTWTRFTRLWRQVGGGAVATAYIERLNATFRERLAPLARRSRHLVREQRTLEACVYLLGTVYNFCWVHRSLGRTPAMAAGLVTARWDVADLLWYRVPAERWRPPRHRGPLSKREAALLAQWGT